MKKLFLLSLLSALIVLRADAQIEKKEDTKYGPAKKPGVTTAPKPKGLQNTCCDAEGNMQVRSKLTRWNAPNDNFLPIATGIVAADPQSDGGLWISPLPSSSVDKISTGRYKVTILNARISARSSIVVSSQSTTPKLCTAKYISPNVFEVYVFNLSGTAVDGGFSFIVNDPLNL